MYLGEGGQSISNIAILNLELGVLSSPTGCRKIVEGNALFERSDEFWKADTSVLGKADGPRLTVKHRKCLPLALVFLLCSVWHSPGLLSSVKSATGPFSQPAVLIPILFSDKIPILLQKIFYLLLLLLSSIKMNALNEQIKPFTNMILIQYSLPSENFFLWHWLHGIFLVE